MHCLELQIQEGESYRDCTSMAGPLPASGGAEEGDILAKSVAAFASEIGRAEGSSSILAGPSAASMGAAEPQGEMGSRRTMAAKLDHTKDRVHEGGHKKRHAFDARKANFRDKVLAKFGKVRLLHGLLLPSPVLPRSNIAPWAQRAGRPCSPLWCAGTSSGGGLYARYPARHGA